MASSPPTVLVIGSGISGLACARALHDSGVGVRVVDRGRVPGGRLATKRLDERPVDIGARYFTVPDGSPFAAVVSDWLHRGLVREWTDTFDVIHTDGSRETKAGPLRYAASAGLRSLAVDIADRLRADGVSIEQGIEVSGVSPEGRVVGGADGEVGGTSFDTVVLAMPDPQARRMLAPGSTAAAGLEGSDGWSPTISVVAAWPGRQWPETLHGAFIDGSPVLAFVADDGDRRGDGAPVLVAHTTPEFAREHLGHPESAVAPVLGALTSLLGITAAPSSTHAHRWTYSAPAAQHAELYLLDGRIAVCGDAWGARSAVPTAWASGTALGHALGRALSQAPSTRLPGPR